MATLPTKAPPRTRAITDGSGGGTAASGRKRAPPDVGFCLFGPNGAIDMPPVAAPAPAALGTPSPTSGYTTSGGGSRTANEATAPDESGKTVDEERSVEVGGDCDAGAAVAADESPKEVIDSPPSAVGGAKGEASALTSTSTDKDGGNQSEGIDASEEGFAASSPPVAQGKEMKEAELNEMRLNQHRPSDALTDSTGDLLESSDSSLKADDLLLSPAKIDPPPSTSEEATTTTATPPTSPPPSVPPRPSKPHQPASGPELEKVLDVNEIRSLSGTSQIEQHNRRVVQAQVMDVVHDLEQSLSNLGGGVGISDRWSAEFLLASDDVAAAAPPQPAAPEPTHIIDLQELRRIASMGIRDAGSHRAVAWRVLLGYLPPDTGQWEEVLKRDRGLYRNLVAELFVQPSHGDSTGEGGAKKPKKQQEWEREGRKLRGRGVEKEGVSVRGIHTLLQNRGGSSLNLETLDGSNKLRHDVKDTVPPDSKNDGDCNPAHGKVCVQVLHEDDDGKTDDNAAEVKPSRRASDQARELFEQTRGPSANGSTPSVEERRKATSNERAVDVVGADAPVPVHSPDALVPARVREQWKNSGREVTALASISSPDGGAAHMNALLVVDDQGKTPDGSREERVAVNDDPLSQETDSKWAQFFENASMLDEIRKDVVRTHPDLYFFLEPEHNLGQRRYAAIERILFVWAKLNKGVRYVQGMNEIVGTIYFVLANDSNEEWACEAEADTYFLFNTLMVEMRDVFVQELDEADTGIHGRIQNMMSLLSLHDPEVRCHLDDCGIDASFYSIRWLTTLLSREFLLPDTIRLWDSMFASTHKDNFLRYVCVSMVMIIRTDLLKGDFSKCLRLLQSYPPTNIDQLLEASRALWIYESQITLACHKGGISLHQALRAIAPPPAIIMAYGLPGGVAPDRGEQIRQAGERGLAVAKGAAKEATNTVATAGKGFFGSAMGFLRSGNDRKQDYHRAKTIG